MCDSYTAEKVIFGDASLPDVAQSVAQTSLLHSPGVHPCHRTPPPDTFSAAQPKSSPRRINPEPVRSEARVVLRGRPARRRPEPRGPTAGWSRGRSARSTEAKQRTSIRFGSFSVNRWKPCLDPQSYGPLLPARTTSLDVDLVSHAATWMWMWKALGRLGSGVTSDQHPSPDRRPRFQNPPDMCCVSLGGCLFPCSSFAFCSFGGASPFRLTKYDSKLAGAIQSLKHPIQPTPQVHQSLPGTSTSRPKMIYISLNPNQLSG